METCLGRERAGDCQHRLWLVSTAPLLVAIAASCTWWVGEGGSFLPDANQERGHVNFFNKGQELELSPPVRHSAKYWGSDPDPQGVPPHILTLKAWGQSEKSKGLRDQAGAAGPQRSNCVHWD